MCWRRWRAQHREGAPEALLDQWADEHRRIFLEVASPQASQNKRVVYSERSPAGRRQDLKNLRRATEHLEFLRRRLRFTEQRRSRSVPA